MNICTATYEILTPIDGVKELQQIEQIGRVCYKSEEKISEDGSSAKAFVRMLIINGHEAMLEHSMLSVKFIVDRGITHELVRHRIASFAQESTRYCNYAKDKFGKGITVVDIKTGISLDFKMRHVPEDHIAQILNEWLDAMCDAERHYMKMLELGATPQIARSVLPTSTKSEIIVTANYREWRSFFKLRTLMLAHPQMREVTMPLLEELKQRLPDVFGDIGERPSRNKPTV